VLGAEKEIVNTFVAAGQVKIVFWPMLDLGENSVNAAAASACAGEQSVEGYWRMHDLLFERQRDLFRADRDYFVETAVALSLDRDLFASCYDGGAAHAQARQLDEARRAANVFTRPTIDVAGERIFGAQSFAVFERAIRNALGE
jgi:protein-disulfide isomerase